MAAALVSAINLMDVPEVIIGGAHFAAVAEIFLPILQSALQDQVLRRHVAPVVLRTAPVGEEANAIGAAALVLHERLPHDAPPSTHASRERRAVHANGRATQARPSPGTTPSQEAANVLVEIAGRR